MRIAIAVAAALLIAACQPQEGRVNLQADEKIQVAESVWDHYQEYLQTVGSARGAFAVSEDGRASAYSYCPVVSGCWSNINWRRRTSNKKHIYGSFLSKWINE